MMEKKKDVLLIIPYNITLTWQMKKNYIMRFIINNKYKVK